jgi:hypothetical protein
MLLEECSQEPLEETAMQIRPQSWVYLAGIAILSAGCTSLSTTTGSDPRTARLPTGVTLLDSNRGQCAGSVSIDATSFAPARRSDLVLQRGENATFELDVDADDDDPEVAWTCVGTAAAERESTECPDYTSYVRITRESTGDNFLLECYGDRDRDNDRR